MPNVEIIRHAIESAFQLTEHGETVAYYIGTAATGLWLWAF